MTPRGSSIASRAEGRGKGALRRPFSRGEARSLSDSREARKIARITAFSETQTILDPAGNCRGHGNRTPPRVANYCAARLTPVLMPQRQQWRYRSPVGGPLRWGKGANQAQEWRDSGENVAAVVAISETTPCSTLAVNQQDGAADEAVSLNSFCFCASSGIFGVNPSGVSGHGGGLTGCCQRYPG